MTGKQENNDRVLGLDYDAERRFANGRQTCLVCYHPLRLDIEDAFIAENSRKSIGQKFNVSAQAAYNHYRNHVSNDVKAQRKLDMLAPGAELKELVEEESIGLLAHLQRIRNGLCQLWDMAILNQDTFNATRLSSQLHANLKISAEKTGELTKASQTNITNIMVDPNFLRFRETVMVALRAHPDAARDVIQALRMAGDQHQSEPLDITPSPNCQRQQ